MQGWGEINSPRPFWVWAKRVLAQPCLLGRVWPRREYFFFWAEIGPIHFGLSPAQSVGPDQPSPFNIIYYIYYILYYLYIYIYEKNYKNFAKIIKKYM
jgi:hypothetical protein